MTEEEEQEERVRALGIAQQIVESVTRQTSEAI